MNQVRLLRCYKHFSSLLPAVVFLAAAAIQGSPLRAQDASQGPIAPPPPDHHVTRIGNEPEPEAPPSLPEAEIVKRFSQKEDEYILSRTHYTYRKTIRIQEFGADGQPSGEFVLVTQPGRDADGKLFETVIERPQSTLQHLFLRSEDLEVVKTYGKWVTDQGDVHTIADLPFSLFETYRENVDGKYWFPSYSRSDDTLNLKGLEISVRIVIKWTDFKPVPSALQAPSPSTPATSPKP